MILEEDTFTEEHSQGNGTVMKNKRKNSHGTEGGVEPLAKVAKITKGDLYKPPTNEELNQLKETENLYQSSLFKMQITELMQEVLMKEKKKGLEAFLHKLKDFLMSLPKGKSYDLIDQNWCRKKNVEVPIIQKPYNVKGKFQFQPPSSVKVIGSYLSGTCVKPGVHVDLSLEIPQECLQAKDHLNYRYLRKRALYLCHISSVLNKTTDMVQSLQYTYHCGHHMKPLLVLKPAGKLGKRLTIRLHVTPPENAFKLNRFHINKNNVRSEWFNETQAKDAEIKGTQPATPHYNTAILRDMTSSIHVKAILETIGESTGVKEGIALLKVWLHQRELDMGHGAFSGFIMTMYVVHLLRIRKLNKLMSSYQIMRNTLLYLTKEDWTTKGISLAENTKDEHQPTLDDYHQHFSVVFVDNSGYVNICSDMTKGTFHRVIGEAKIGLEQMDTNNQSLFNVLFMSPVPFTYKFDNILHIQRPETLVNSMKKLGLDSKTLDYCSNVPSHVLPNILDILTNALGKRVTLIANKLYPAKQWSITDKAPEMDITDCLSIGMMIDPDHSYSVLEKGPPADTSEATAFRDFWGEKSELRRFQDGSICEAVVWPCDSIACRRQVIGRIAKYILTKHAGIKKDRMKCVSVQLDPLLRPAQSKRKRVIYGTGEEEMLNVMKVSDNLCKQLRQLKELPLTINTIQGTSPVYRCAEVFPPMSYTVPTGKGDDDAISPWMPSMKIICVLEGSGKWPEDKDAIKHVKAAFHIKMADLLMEQHSMKCQVHPEYIDVLKDGFVFRVQIGYIMEIAVLKMVKTPEGMLKTLDTEVSGALEREIVVLPKMTSALHGLHQKYRSYSVTVRLAKRWVSSQLLSNLIKEEAIELIVAYLYISPAPYTVPNCPLTAFLRFLHLVSHHDWNGQPLFVDLNSDFTKDNISTVERKFTKERTALPVMCIVTPYDKPTSFWTYKAPTAPILNRLMLLAKESAITLEAQLSGGCGDKDFKLIFRPPLDIYDVIIHLNHQALSRGHQAVDVSKDAILPSRSTNTQSTDVIPVVDFDPVPYYIEQLKAVYGDIALFFYDKYGGDVVAVLWKPNVLLPKPFKVHSLHYHKIDTETSGKETKVVPNIDAILEDFQVFGRGLVSSVKCQNK